MRLLLECFPDIKRLVIFWGDGLKQFEMARTFDPGPYTRLPYWIGGWGLNSFQSQIMETLVAELRIALLGLLERAEIGGYGDSTLYACYQCQPPTYREWP